MRTLSLVSDSRTPCGIETFQRRLAETLAAREPGAHGTCAIVGQPGELAVLDRALGGADVLVAGLPMVAWKRRLAAPMRAMALARLRGKGVLLVLHEWTHIDWKRRLLLRAYVPFATRLMFSSPYVQAQFEADFVARFATRDRALVPIPSGVARPAQLPETDLSRHLAALRASGRTLVCQFGGVYPTKNPAGLLEVVASLQRRGRPAQAVFVGDFVGNATVNARAAFDAARRNAGLAAEDVMVTGYIADAGEVLAAIAACDVAVSRFPEGLTSRRSSVLAALQTHTPVLVNAPPTAHEFDHHAEFRRALASGALTMLPTDADADAFAAAIEAAAGVARRTAVAVDFDRACVAAADAVVA